MTKLSDHVLSQQAHMNRVRAIHRRSAFERVLSKIATMQGWDPMSDDERDQLEHLIELRGVIRKELIEHGQLEA